MKKIDIEVVVGIFIFCGILSLGYISIKLGNINLFSNNYYPISATFTTVKGLKANTGVEISGVEVGRVEKILLDGYNAEVQMSLRKDIQLQDDAIASIRTKGLLGEKYVEIAPGGSDVMIEPGGKIFDTEPPIDIENLIKNFVFGKVEK